MSFSRLLSSSYHSFISAVPTFVDRHPVATAAVSLVAISYAAPRLIHYFTTRRHLRAMDLVHPSRMWERFMISMTDRVCNVRETDDSLILRLNLLSGNVQKDEVDVTVDHNTLTIKDALPGRNQFSSKITLNGKHCDLVNTKVKMMENNVLQIVIPKLKKDEEEDEEDDGIVHHIDVE